ncbi:MAG TPA: FtsQ-type POTRA domain-containing protein [Anaerolineae bacterium]|nr:FtsQ-type POTRA domain-containing protein [Anaerolineae bacterium]
MRIPLVTTKRKPQAQVRRPNIRGRKQRFHEAVPLKAGVAQRRVRTQASPPIRRRTTTAVAEARADSATPSSAVWLQFRRMVAARWWALALLLLLLSGAAYATSDERFFVYEAVISGTQHLDPQAVYAAADIDKQSIFWVDPRRVEGQVSSLQGVKSVDVSCSLPSQISIHVEERQPVILWRSESQHRDWWLDAEGVVLPYHGDTQAPSTVFVIDYSGRILVPGDQVEPSGLASSVRELAASLTGVRVFFHDANRGLFYTQVAQAGEWPVYVGDSADLAHKIQVTELLNQHFQDSTIKPTYVDVRWADRPVYGSSSGRTASGDN